MSQYIKNPTKLLRNPNSPEAIQARLDGYSDPTPFANYSIIVGSNPEHAYGTVNIDLTKDKILQRISYPITGGSKALTKKLVRSSMNLDAQGRAVMTSYYIDTRNQQSVMIRGFYNPTGPNTNESAGPSRPAPLPTVGGTLGGFFASAPGENWRNQGRSKDDIIAAQKRVFATTPIESNTDQTIDNPVDEYLEDFTGND